MSRREHPVDGHIRQLPLVGDEQAHLESDSDARQALFEEIITMPLDTDTTVPGTRDRRIPRRGFVLVAALALLSSAAVGWAVISSLGSTTSVACHTGGSPDSGAGIDMVTGDPVADCAAVWERHTGQPPPELIAYDNGTGGIAVMPADAEVPEDWQPLEAGTMQDARVIELRVALDDHIAGLPSRCHLTEEGQALAERELERLGLSGWSVATERGEADGIETCAYFHLDPDRPRVVLSPREGLVAPVDAPSTVLARDLGTAVADGCLTTAETAEVARRIAGEVGIDGDGLVVNEVADPEATCARAHVNVFGRIEVTVRGPEPEH